MFTCLNFLCLQAILKKNNSHISFYMAINPLCKIFDFFDGFVQLNSSYAINSFQGQAWFNDMLPDIIQMNIIYQFHMIN